jgi:hypothetical protein
MKKHCETSAVLEILRNTLIKLVSEEQAKKLHAPLHNFCFVLLQKYDAKIFTCELQVVTHLN